MEQFVAFMQNYGWQLTLIAIAGVIILGILKYCKVFDKLDEKVRHFLYLLISVGLSIIGSVIYLACMHQLDATYVFALATAIFGINQIAYTIYDTTPLRDLLSKIWEKILEFANKKNNESDNGSTDTSEEDEPELEPEPIEPTIVSIPVAITGLVYNGNEQTGVKSTELYTVINGSATNAGNYEATVTLIDTTKYIWEAEFNGKVAFNIEKATYDMSGVSFPDTTITYDGTAHSIFISGDLPENVTVSYNNNNHTDIGNYEIVASFLGDELNYNKIEDMKATLTIEKVFPKIIAIVDTSKNIYPNSDFPEITISEDSTPGIIAWEANQKLQVGTNRYSWKFTPDSENYYTAIGTSTFTVIEAKEDNISNTISFNDGTSTEMEVHLPALGKATFNINGAEDYTIKIESNYGVTAASIIELLYYVKGNERPFLPLADDYVTEFDIDKQADYFVINCTPDQYDYKKLLERKWSSDEVTFSSKLTKEFTYKMTVTSAEGKMVTIYLEQD